MEVSDSDGNEDCSEDEEDRTQASESAKVLRSEEATSPIRGSAAAVTSSKLLEPPPFILSRNCHSSAIACAFTCRKNNCYTITFVCRTIAEKLSRNGGTSEKLLWCQEKKEVCFVLQRKIDQSTVVEGAVKKN